MKEFSICLTPLHLSYSSSNKLYYYELIFALLGITINRITRSLFMFSIDEGKIELDLFYFRIKKVKK